MNIDIFVIILFKHQISSPNQMAFIHYRYVFFMFSLFLSRLRMRALCFMDIFTVLLHRAVSRVGLCVDANGVHV